ncbi:hypothetical protein J2J97_32515 (plasmid) [Rhizobium bangladeshense]|uniref:hypothetical protein n=1 Tax=Rhizobium bangladeshense TaxID=1138189 RepID=UPI001A996A95|nr:hypothetical protein [Rhizobium bangladeshense]QSY98629.1 hypothetical protein J2J97_32515 [Rhizobium bangladeshense]
MSSRMHRAIGWGIEWNAFEATTILDCEGHDTWEKLDAVLSAATDETLTVPMDERQETRRARGVSPIFDNRLLALDMEFAGEGDERHRVEPKLANATTLRATVMDPDNTHAVLFFPNADYARKWHRRYDDLDYAFEAYRNGPPGDAEPRDFWHVAKFGWFPFANYLMDKDGNPLEWESFHRLDYTYPEGWYPAVPSEIRWYLKKLGIMDDAGVNKLRPIVAQWWC